MELDSYAGLGARYGPLILHMLADSVHRTLMNAFKSTTNQNSFFMDSSWNFNASLIEGLKTQPNRVYVYSEQMSQGTDS